MYQLIFISSRFLGSLSIPDFLKWGTCNSVHVQENFDITKYQGAWWESMAVPNHYVVTKSCAIMNYQQDCYSLNVSTTGLDENNNKVLQTSRLDQGSHPGDMVVDAPGVPSAPFQVLETDYRNYSCVYSCLGYGFFKVEFTWVFSRTPELSSEDKKRCISAFDKYKIDVSSMKNIKQGKGCPYYNSQAKIIARNNDFLDSLNEINSNSIDSHTSQPKTLPSSLPEYCISRNNSASYIFISYFMIFMTSFLASLFL